MYVYWKVTRSLVSYDKEVIHRDTFDVNWKVTRSLVSYDFEPEALKAEKSLKGHQIIGELRLTVVVVFDLAMINWKVTRSLVSYDSICVCFIISNRIERSPDHWWVTTYPRGFCCFWHVLKGHQIIGELRLKRRMVICKVWIERSPDHWWVTTRINLSD